MKGDTKFHQSMHDGRNEDSFEDRFHHVCCGEKDCETANDIGFALVLDETKASWKSITQ